MPCWKVIGFPLANVAISTADKTYKKSKTFTNFAVISYAFVFRAPLSERPLRIGPLVGGFKMGDSKWEINE